MVERAHEGVEAAHRRGEFAQCQKQQRCGAGGPEKQREMREIAARDDRREDIVHVRARCDLGRRAEESETRHCERSQAIQNERLKKLDCFAALATAHVRRDNDGYCRTAHQRRHAR